MYVDVELELCLVLLHNYLGPMAMATHATQYLRVGELVMFLTRGEGGREFLVGTKYINDN